MAKLKMNGPYPLSAPSIDAQITRKSCGNYALGYENSDRKFMVCYVGRSDSDVNKRLKQWIDESEWPLFKYSYATSSKDAFERECANYHDFSPRDNSNHPDRPNGSGWKCPRCDIFDND